MYKVTERRLAKAEPILEEFRTILHSKGKINAREFEMKLRECWNVGYGEMKSLAEDLSTIERYRFLAVYYMEYSNGSRDVVASEFKEVLAKIYKIDYYHHPELSVKRDAFWDSMPKE
jgi:hypothetical protein